MAAITASMVGELRAKTDAPMMECKRALTEAGGDMDRAEELLRVKLGSKASRASTRVTSEGIVALFVEGDIGAMVELNCETDFVAKNDDFLQFGNTLARLIATRAPVDLAALSALEIDGVTAVHDLHVWSITTGLPALSGHVRVDERAATTPDETLGRIAGALRERFGILHSTLQIESSAFCERCDVGH